MKTSKITLLAVLVTTGALVSAQGIGTATDEAEATGDSGAADVASLPMHHQMHRMHEKMAQMHAATNPQERRKLMKEHMESMKGMMQMMHGMMAGQGMMGPRHRGMMMRHGKMAPKAKGQDMMGTPCPQRAEGDRLSRMEQRMNLMQMMMDQMLKAQFEQLGEN